VLDIYEMYRFLCHLAVHRPLADPEVVGGDDESLGEEPLWGPGIGSNQGCHG